MVELFSDSQAPDLKTADGVKAYLFQTPYRAINVTSLAGGFTNFTYRVKLQTPFFDMGASPGALISTVVLKYAELYPAVNIRGYLSAVERQNYEVLACREVPTIISLSTNISLPKVYFQDRDNHVIIMYDCGEGCMILEDYLKFHPVPLEVARRIGSSLGHFIGELHVASHQSRPADSPGVLLKHKFERAHEPHSFAFFYGIIKGNFPRTTERYDEIIALVDNMHEKIKSSNEVLVMGDFWTGNILIHGNSLEHLCVIDWETASPSLAGLDVGRLLAEVYTISKFYPSSRSTVHELISAFIASYKSVVAPEMTTRDFNEIVKVAAFNVGVYLIVIHVVKSEWESDEGFKELFLEGISFLLNAESEMWRRESFLGALCV